MNNIKRGILTVIIVFFIFCFLSILFSSNVSGVSKVDIEEEPIILGEEDGKLEEEPIILEQDKDNDKFKDINYIFIGDSRTVGLKYVADKRKDCKFLCKVGQSYKYMTQIFPQALQLCEKNKKNIIVSWFGINNVNQSEKYANYFNNKKLPDNVHLVVLSITDGYNYKGLSINISEFNKIMQDNANNYTYIDITDKIGNGKSINVTDVAKLHYSKNSDEVFAVIMDKIKSKYL